MLQMQARKFYLGSRTAAAKSKCRAILKVQTLRFAHASFALAVPSRAICNAYQRWPKSAEVCFNRPNTLYPLQEQPGAAGIASGTLGVQIPVPSAMLVHARGARR